MKLIKKDLICHYGLPARLIIENAQNFNEKLIIELCTKWKIKHLNSYSYRQKMNEVVAEANKNLKKIIQKMVVIYKDWNEMFLYTLHVYRTIIRTSMGVTPYFLVYRI